MTPFEGDRVKLALALKITLPTHTIRLTEGGEIDFNGERYADTDPIFGVITEYENFTSGESDTAPALEFTWAVKDIAAAVALCAPSSQGSPVEWSILRVNRDTNAVIDSELMFFGIVDTCELKIDVNAFELRMGLTTEIDRLLNIDKGNRLNRAHHRSVWPGETGLDYMTGTDIPAPWGDPQRQRQSSGGGGNFTQTVRSVLTR
jgi:hypothetical protein